MQFKGGINLDNKLCPECEGDMELEDLFEKSFWECCYCGYKLPLTKDELEQLEYERREAEAEQFAEEEFLKNASREDLMHY